MKHQIMTVMLDAFLIINALPPVSAKTPLTPPPTFSMVHLLHRLYGVDDPGLMTANNVKTGRETRIVGWQNFIRFRQ